MKQKTIVQKHKIASLNSEVQVPWNVWRFFGTNEKLVLLAGNQICLGEDYGSLEDCRSAVTWYVEQLGGKVTW